MFRSPFAVQVHLHVNRLRQLCWTYSKSTAQQQYGHTSRLSTSCNYCARRISSAASRSYMGYSKLLPRSQRTQHKTARGFLVLAWLAKWTGVTTTNFFSRAVGDGKFAHANARQSYSIVEFSLLADDAENHVRTIDNCNYNDTDATTSLGEAVGRVQPGSSDNADGLFHIPVWFSPPFLPAKAMLASFTIVHAVCAILPFLCAYSLTGKWTRPPRA